MTTQIYYQKQTKCHSEKRKKRDKNNLHFQTAEIEAHKRRRMEKLYSASKVADSRRNKNVKYCLTTSPEQNIMSYVNSIRMNKHWQE